MDERSHSDEGRLKRYVIDLMLVRHRAQVTDLQFRPNRTNRYDPYALIVVREHLLRLGRTMWMSLAFFKAAFSASMSGMAARRRHALAWTRASALAASLRLASSSRAFIAATSAGLWKFCRCGCIHEGGIIAILTRGV